MSLGTEIEPPTFYEVLSAAKDRGLVGEEQTLLTTVLGIVRGGLIVLTGPARAGKDEVVDAAASVFESNNLIYRWPVDDSETAAYYDRDKINQYPVHRFPDLARLEEHHEKILKAFGEGRDSRRNRTDIAAQQRGDSPVEDQVLKCPRTVIAFIATDNENIDLDDFPELRNRALILSVDASEEQTNNVNHRKAMEHADLTENSVSVMRRAQIQDYHSTIPVSEWTDNPARKIVNPAAVEIHSQEPIPQKFPEARQDFDRLLEFMGTVTLYNYANRISTDTRLLTTPVDIWEAMTILGNKMVMSALNMTREDRAILVLLDSSNAQLTKTEIQQRLRQSGLNITDRDVVRSLDSMRLKGYVREIQGTPNSYTVSEFANVVRHSAGLDYSKIVESAEENIYKIVDTEVADKYVETHCRGDGLITIHPFNGKSVDITETDDLEELMDEGFEEIESAVSTSSDSTESEPTEENKQLNAKIFS